MTIWQHGSRPHLLAVDITSMELCQQRVSKNILNLFEPPNINCEIPIITGEKRSAFFKWRELIGNG